MAPPEQAPSPPFVVKGRRRNGFVTYLCPTPQWALRKLADFDRAGYTELEATRPDGRPIDADGLAKLAEAVVPADADA